MKKGIKIVSALCLIFVLLFALSGCNANDKIKKNFEDAGYNVSSTKVEEGNDAYDALVAIYGEEDAKGYIGYEWISVSKEGFANIGKSGTILCYASANDLKEKLGEDYQEAVDNGLVNGNCYLITVSNDVKEIFAK